MLPPHQWQPTPIPTGSAPNEKCVGTARQNGGVSGAGKPQFRLSAGRQIWTPFTPLSSPDPLDIVRSIQVTRKIWKIDRFDAGFFRLPYFWLSLGPVKPETLSSCQFASQGLRLVRNALGEDE